MLPTQNRVLVTKLQEAVESKPMGLYMTEKDGFLGTWMTRDTVEEVTTPFIITQQKMCVNVFSKYASVENR